MPVVRVWKLSATLREIYKQHEALRLHEPLPACAAPLPLADGSRSAVSGLCVPCVVCTGLDSGVAFPVPFRLGFGKRCFTFLAFRHLNYWIASALT